jgi:hypothetical protein
VNWPVAQDLQTSLVMAFETFENVPMPHGTAVRGVGQYEPAGQGKGTATPLGQKVPPTVHAEQAERVELPTFPL